MPMKRIALVLSFTLAGAISAHAQPTMVKQFEDWGVYSYSKGGETVCCRQASNRQASIMAAISS